MEENSKFNCENCGVPMQEDDPGIVVIGKLWCEECFAKEFFDCPRCGDTWHMNDSAIEHDGEIICENCLS